MMTLLPRAYNPILWQEFTHQMRNAPYSMRRELLVGSVVALLLIALVVALLLSPDGYLTTQLALLSVWGFHAFVALRAIIAGANAISREHVGLTWDTLVLTGVSARRIIFGKWRAVMRRVGGWMVLLGALQLAMLPVYMLAMTKTYAWVMCRAYSSYAYSGCGASAQFSWVPWGSLVAVVMAIVLTVLEVAACTALGMAASAVTRRGILAAVLAISLRFAPVAAFAGFTRYEIGTTFWRWWRFSPFALADGGTVPIMRLVHPDMPWTRGQHEWALQTLTLPLLLLAGLLVISLVLTHVLVRRTGALSHAEAAAPPEVARAFGG